MVAPEQLAIPLEDPPQIPVLSAPVLAAVLPGMAELMLHLAIQSIEADAAEEGGDEVLP